MDIGIPREQHDLDLRVGLGTNTVAQLCAAGHAVYVERGAGVGSGFSDESYIAAGATITVNVGVDFINEEECPGLKSGGVLNVVRYEIELVCPAASIPESIVIDLTGLEIGDGVHISSVTLPADCEPTITDRDFTIATIAAPTIVVEPEPEEEEGLEGEEGEGIEGEEGEEGEGGEGEEGGESEGGNE